jgi:hypothetical protein
MSLDWDLIKDKLTKNARDHGDITYENQIIDKGEIQWDITINDPIFTDSGKQVIFEGPYKTWYINAYHYNGNYLYSYYYTYRSIDKLEVWVWADCKNNYRHIFWRDYSKDEALAQFPDHRSKGYAGYTLTHPAMLLPANNPPGRPLKPTISISTNGYYAWVPYIFTTTASDPDGDQVKYTFDWDDNKKRTLTDPANSNIVTSATHSWQKAGRYSVTVMATDIDIAQCNSQWSLPLTVKILANNPPGKPSEPYGGPTSGITRTTYTYSTVASDPDGDKVTYTFDWDDGTPFTPTDQVKSNTPASSTHSWTNAGIYHVKAKATDVKGAPSDWSDPLEVTISAPDDVCSQGCKYSCIQDAIDAANSGDTIHVAEGTYKADPCRSIHINKSLTIIGAGADKTIIDGNQAGSVITIDPNINVILSGMTIQGGTGTLTYLMPTQRFTDWRAEAFIIRAALTSIIVAL